MSMRVNLVSVEVLVNEIAIIAITIIAKDLIFD